MSKKICVDCGSDNVHYIEFRTDGGASARIFYSLNDAVEDMDTDELPKYLSGNYCGKCQGFCSTVDDSNRTVTVPHPAPPGAYWKKGTDISADNKVSYWKMLYSQERDTPLTGEKLPMSSEEFHNACLI